MAKPLTISIVICTYTERRWDNLLAVTRALRNQTVQPDEIVIVVDHNRALLDRVRAELPTLHIIENTMWPGAGGARNSSISFVKGDIIAFLDDDATPQPDWLERLHGSYDSPDVLGVGGGINPDWVSAPPRWFPAEFNWVVGCTYRGMPTSRAAVRNLIGANMSFRREVFSLIGYFRNDLGRVNMLPIGCEETEFCIRLHQLQPNAILLYEPGVVVNHAVPNVRSRWSYYCSRCYYEGRSKARVARIVGAQHGLESERKYLSTLAQGVRTGFADTFLHGDISGVMRAGAIITGLSITTIGYTLGRLLEARRALAPQRPVVGISEVTL